MRCILVTGASGFVGSHLRAALRVAFPSTELLAATRGEPVHGWDGAIQVDLLDFASCVAALRQALPDAIIHLAAVATVNASFHSPLLTWQTNLVGTVTLGESVLAEVPEALFVHASSAEVYGLSFSGGSALDEAAPLRPANPYAASKAAADIAIGEIALRGLRTVRLRPVNHTGVGQSDKFVVSAFARQIAMIAARQIEPVLYVGALDRWRDFLDVADVCAGYVAALRARDQLAPGAVFNLASGTPRHIGDILSELLRLAAVKVQIVQQPARLRPTDVLCTHADATAARDQLGWHPEVPWHETLQAVLNDWRARVG